jgi:hypothetical protein
VISYILTPWDSAVFKVKTAEIVFEETKVYSYEEISQSFNEIEEKLAEETIEFCYTRVNSNDIRLKKLLFEKNFYFAESSLEISKLKVQKFESKKLPALKLEVAQQIDIHHIKEIANSSFDFSRFHEDPYIELDLAKARYENWIDDLVKQNVIIQVAKVNDEIVGINIQKFNPLKKEVSLILCGCKKGAELYVLSLWNEIISYNKEAGTRKISTLISASNTNMANIYSYFDFKINKTLFGYHKSYNNENH